MAPLIGKKKDGKKTEDGEKVVYGFRVVHVFDIGQTEGVDLPEIDLLVTGEVDENLDRLEQIVAEHEIALSYDPESEMDGALGLSKGGKITVLDSLESASRFSVLAHELGHELLHRGERRLETTKVIRETEAEAVAYVVCKSIGIDCGSKTADYIQLYNGDDKLLLRSLEFVRSVSSLIISKLQTPAATESQLAS